METIWSDAPQPSVELSRDTSGLPRATGFVGCGAGIWTRAASARPMILQSFTTRSKTMNIHKGFMTYESHAPPRRSTGVPVNYHSPPGRKTADK